MKHTILLWACLLACRTGFGAATLPAGVSEIVRQLHEWREVSSGWLAEATVLQPTNSQPFRVLRGHYIEASAIANSLISQFQLETTARTPMNPKRYEANVNRARSACESLSREAKKIVLESPPKTRGAAAASTASKGETNDLTRLVFEGAERTVGMAGGLMDMIGKNRRAFVELDEKQRKQVNDLLEATKWPPLAALLSQPQEHKK